jgi:hypothetical protein
MLAEARNILEHFSRILSDAGASKIEILEKKDSWRFVSLRVGTFGSKGTERFSII